MMHFIYILKYVFAVCIFWVCVDEERSSTMVCIEGQETDGKIKRSHFVGDGLHLQPGK